MGGGRKAIIIFVPVPQLKSFQKIQVRLVRELEKKFSGKHVVFIAQVGGSLSQLSTKCWFGGGVLMEVEQLFVCERCAKLNQNTAALYILGHKS